MALTKPRVINGQTITFDQALKELKRELAMRKKVYPNRISSGQMHQHEADNYNARLLYWIQMAEEIQDKDRGQAKLF